MQEGEEEILAAQLIYSPNGDDQYMQEAFQRVSSSTSRWTRLGIYMGVYPLDDSLCNEISFLHKQTMRRSDTFIVSALENSQDHYYFALYLPLTGEMIGVVRWAPRPILDEASGELVFQHTESSFVYLLPGTALFPNLDSLSSFVVDARLSVKIIS